jgi:hypothetical protein
MLVTMMDVVWVILFIIPVLALAFIMFYFFLLYLMLLVIVAVILVPMSLCYDELPTAEHILRHYRHCISLPYQYVWMGYQAGRQKTRECILPEPQHHGDP